MFKDVFLSDVISLELYENCVSSLFTEIYLFNKCQFENESPTMRLKNFFKFFNLQGVISYVFYGMTGKNK